jgi:hypothetical protein
MKILVLKDNITDNDTLQKGILLATQKCATIGLILEFTQVNNQRIFSSIPISNNIVLNGYVVNPTEIFTEAKSFNIPFDVDLLVYDADNISPRPTNPDDGGMNLQIPTFWYTTFPEVFAEFFTHELCHFFFQKYQKPDTTHDYPPEWGQKPRIDYYLFLISQLIPPVLPPQSSPSVVLTRNSDNGVETLGTLSVGDKFQCQTLERPFRNNQPNISAIPTGTYTCSYKFMLRELSYRYQIMNVPNRSGIFFHAGNYFFNSLGCILVGSTPVLVNGQMALQNSRTILNYFEMMMGKKDFQLKIL